jgi:hypothetical protein
MMPLPKEEAEAHMKAMYANGGMHGGEMQGGARTTVAALTGVATNPSETLKEFKGFFEDLAGIWNGGDVATGLRTKGKSAFATLIKYLPLAGAPGYTAATALEKLKIDSIINLLATLIDLITGRATLPQLFEALKEFVGNIFDMVKDFATNVLPAIGNAVVSGLTSVGNTIVEGLDPRLKAEGEARRKNERLAGAERQYADLVTGKMRQAAEQAFTPPKPMSKAYLDSGTREKPVYEFPDDFKVKEAVDKARNPPNVIDPFAGMAGQEMSTEAFAQQQRIVGAERSFPYIPYWLWLRDHLKPEDEYLAKYFPRWTKDEFFAKGEASSPGVGQDSSTEYGNFVATLQEKGREGQQERFDAEQVTKGDVGYIQKARGKLVKQLSSELGYNVGENAYDLEKSDYPYTGEDLTYVYSSAYSKYPKKDATDMGPPTPGKSRYVANPPGFPNYEIVQGVTPDGQSTLKKTAIDSHAKIEPLFKVLVWNHALEKLQGGPNENLPSTKRKAALLQKINSLNGGTAYLAANNYETMSPQPPADGSPVTSTAPRAAPQAPTQQEIAALEEKARTDRLAVMNAAFRTPSEKEAAEGKEVMDAFAAVAKIKEDNPGKYNDYGLQQELGRVPYPNPPPGHSQEENKLRYPLQTALNTRGSGMSGGSMLIDHAMRYHPHKRMRENYDPRFFM